MCVHDRHDVDGAPGCTCDLCRKTYGPSCDAGARDTDDHVLEHLCGHQGSFGHCTLPHRSKCDRSQGFSLSLSAGRNTCWPGFLGRQEHRKIGCTCQQLPNALGEALSCHSPGIQSKDNQICPICPGGVGDARGELEIPGASSCSTDHEGVGRQSTAVPNITDHLAFVAGGLVGLHDEPDLGLQLAYPVGDEHKGRSSRVRAIQNHKNSSKHLSPPLIRCG